MRYSLLLFGSVFYYSSVGIEAGVSRSTTQACILTQEGCGELRGSDKDEPLMAYKRRNCAASRQLLLRDSIQIRDGLNKSEREIPSFAASFTKTLEHDEKTGLLTQEGKKNYIRLIEALRTGKQADFDQVKRYRQATIKFINPQGAYMFSSAGSDSSLFKLEPFFELSSVDAATSMLEVYLMALCRDVFFSDYGTGRGTDSDESISSLTSTASKVLQVLNKKSYKGPRTKKGHIDKTVLFRGNSAGDLIGPYVSQFLLMPLKLIFPSASGAEVFSSYMVETKQLRCVAQKREFGVSFKDFVALQNGVVPKKYAVTDYDFKKMRYPVTGRDLASLTHYDRPYEIYHNTVTLLASHGFPLSKVFPYGADGTLNESPLVSMGIADVYSMLGTLMLEGLKASWTQKWRVYRALRPEAFAALVHRARTTGLNEFKLHHSLFAVHKGIDVLRLIRKRNEKQSRQNIDPQQLLNSKEASTYLLGQVYPQGAPVHPTYPASHAAVAGACVTIIKAFFDDTVKISSKFNPVKVNPLDPTTVIPLRYEGESEMTVGSELDKLASNIAFGRVFAGVHYRCDCAGLELGEEVAIRYLQDHACEYTEQGFKGFELTKRDGTRIRITPERVIEINKGSNAALI